MEKNLTLNERKLAAALLQISRQDFSKALKELGHEPEDYRGKKLALTKLLDQYKLEEEEVLNAIEKKLIAAHYDYYNDIIWVDALDAAHYYYCTIASQG